MPKILTSILINCEDDCEWQQYRLLHIFDIFSGWTTSLLRDQLDHATGIHVVCPLCDAGDANSQYLGGKNYLGEAGEGLSVPRAAFEVTTQKACGVPWGALMWRMGTLRDSWQKWIWLGCRYRLNLIESHANVGQTVGRPGKNVDWTTCFISIVLSLWSIVHCGLQWVVVHTNWHINSHVMSWKLMYETNTTFRNCVVTGSHHFTC